jgi:hypothetical protein
MNRRRLCIVVCLLCLSADVSAQSGEVSKPAVVKTVSSTAKAAKDPEAERILLERRGQALSLLISLATDAGTFNDQRLRARTQARIADALWETDSDRARSLFRKAWDAAEIADAEGLQRMQEAARDQQAKSGGGGYAVSSPPEIRKEVLRLAVKHDASLGEEFLGKLMEKGKEPSTKDNPIDPREKDPASTQRLDVAKELLSSGDKERALQFGSPLLNSINMQSIEFLASLREKDATLADARYASMLNLAVANPQSDVNTVAMLSSYIFSPHSYFTMVGSGAYSTSRTIGGIGPADVAPALRLAFLRVAGEILMRPIQPGQDTIVFFTYKAIQGYLPLFEQFAPPELTARMRTQLEALTAMVPESQRRNPEEPARDAAGPPKPTTDSEQPLLDRIDRAKTSAEQDQLYLQLALHRADVGDIKAREFADNIADSELRQSVRSYIDASLAFKAIEKKDVERALEIVRTGELTRLLKVWTMAHAARLLAAAKSPDRERALQVLDDAAAEARRMDGSDADRPRAFLAVSSALLAIDRTRGWDSMTDVVKAANSAPDFTGEDGELTFSISTKGIRSMHQHGMSEFNVAEVFQSLANENYDRAVALARVFELEAPRANAVMAIALSILNQNRR